MIHFVRSRWAAASLRMAGVTPNQLFDFGESLSFGRVTDVASVDAWVRERMAVWQAVPGPLPTTLHRILRTPDEFVDQLRKADEVVIWLADNLDDILSLLWLIRVRAAVGAADVPLHLARLTELPGNSSTRHGGFHPEDLEIDAASWTRISEAENAQAEAAWTAYTSSSPKALDALVREAGHLDWIAQALAPVYGFFPHIEDTLDKWERRLLDLARRHSTDAGRIVGRCMRDWADEPDLSGDQILFAKLLSLGAADMRYPLLKIQGTGVDMRRTKATITQFGTAVLDGHDFRTRGNPLDRWVGGTHLDSSTGMLWCYDGRGLVKTPPIPNEL